MLSVLDLFSGIGGIFDYSTGIWYNARMSNKYTYTLPFTKDQLATDYTAGLTQVEIAHRYHTTQKVVWRAMINLGVPSRIAKKRNQAGPNNDSWKGQDAKYAACHLRVQTLRGKPQKCEVCGTTDVNKSYQWACLSGHFDDPSDYKRMCRSCHSKHDRVYRNLGEYMHPKGVMPNA
jgi:hypothetical protein